VASRRTFGGTWWGRAWVEALEDSAQLDPNRLAKGRTYARQDRVGPLDIQPGFVTARVRGNHGRIYRTDVAVRPLAPSEWEQVADAIAATSGHAAALLDGELSPRIVADAAALDIRLLPGPGDLRPDCSCPDWAEPCKHAAAVCYLVADELDRDPFILFTLRGVGRHDLLAMVRERRSAAAGHPDGEGPGAGPASGHDALGVGGDEAWRDRPLDAPLDPVPEVVAATLAHLPTAPVAPPRWEAELPTGLGIRPRSVDALAADASVRAFEMLVDGSSSALRTPFPGDLARRAAHLDRRGADQLARELGWHPSRLAARVEAWELGGELGVLMLDDPDLWSRDQAALDAGRDALIDLGYSRRQVSLNYDSLRMRDNVWLAIGPDDRWYRFQERGKRHEMRLTAPPSSDIADLVDPPAAG
jgi:uncharacterized Zn finger protein